MSREEPFRTYRIHLPHWRAHDAAYFVTWCVKRGVRDLLPDEREVVSKAITHFDGQRYEVLAYVVMNDHVHVLLRLFADWRLEQVLHSWKSYTAKVLLRARGDAGSIWQRETYDRVVRNAGELRQTARYILDNPDERWPGIEDYPWRGGTLAATRTTGTSPSRRAGEPAPTPNSQATSSTYRRPPGLQRRPTNSHRVSTPRRTRPYTRRFTSVARRHPRGARTAAETCGGTS